jgi:uncharacterized membrane protein
MAQLKLGRYDAELGRLPPRCMRCGEAPSLTKAKKFSWYPSWVYLLILVHLLVFLIVAAIMTKRMRVPVPLCEKHKNHFLWPTLLGVAALLLLLAVIFGGIALAGALEGELDPDAQGVFFTVWFVGGLGLFLAVLITACVVQARTIRPTEITDRGMTLTNVAREFVGAFKAGDLDDEEYDLPRSRGRDVGSPYVYDPETRRRPLPPDAYRASDE